MLSHVPFIIVTFASGSPQRTIRVIVDTRLAVRANDYFCRQDMMWATGQSY
jgi:hypothetical protein